jgi:toll-like receptor 2
MKSCNLRHIAEEAFHGLPNLFSLYLSRNRLTEIHKNTFIHNPGLTFLDLSSNLLKHINSETFKNVNYFARLLLASNQLAILYPNTFPETRLLNISYNNISYISRDAFYENKIPAVTLLSSNPIGTNNNFTLDIWQISKSSKIDLSFCNLTTFPISHQISRFYSLLNLSNNHIISWTNTIMIESTIVKLDLHNNKISYVDKDMIKFLKIVNDLDLGGNPFNCQDCNLLDFQTFLLTTPVKIFNFQTRNPLTCFTPEEFKGKKLNSISYVCDVRNETALWTSIGILTSALAIFLLVTPVVAFVYRYELYYIRQLWHMKRRNEKREGTNETNCKFDAFVSYCHEDRSWVFDILLPALEKPVDGYTLCLHERDFRLGSFIMDSIMENLETSRRIIFILTNAFLKSEVNIYISVHANLYML